MPLSVAKKILDYELSMDDGVDVTNIKLFGGEPFLEFELIKSIVEYVKLQDYSRNFKIGITTNGTLVHGKVKDWLCDNKDIVTCGLSLDGNKVMHDLNRSNSFNDIDLEFFVKTYPNQSIKMTISPDTLPMLFDGIKFCHEIGFKVSCNLAYGPDWSDECNERLLERELLKMIEYYLVNPNIIPCSMLSTDIEKIGYDNVPLEKWCGAGINVRAYDVYGNSHPCQYFMSISNPNDIDKSNLTFMSPIPVELLDIKCQSCRLFPICPSCYGYNYFSTGNMYSKEEVYCKLTKIILKAQSYFKYKQWTLGRLKLSPDEEQALLRSIKIIQDSLK